MIDFNDLCHVVPVDEINGHRPIDCHCHPQLSDEDYEVVVHNSFDGREAFEEGERKLS